VYAVGHSALTREGWWLAGVLAVGGDAVLSHRSAAELWGIRTRGWPKVDVTTTRSTRAMKGIDLHRTRRLNAITERKGIPVTTPDRTLVDLAEVLPEDEVQRALHQAQTLSLIAHDTGPDPINGRRGTAKLRAPKDPSRSVLERRFKRLCRDAGIEEPENNVMVAGLEVDFLWRERRLVVELDGWQYHRSRQAFERDRERDARLTRAGHTVLRFTHRQVTERPGEVVGAVLGG
jgi:very-short-patch-repair endonuclease